MNVVFKSFALHTSSRSRDVNDRKGNAAADDAEVLRSRLGEGAPRAAGKAFGPILHAREPAHVEQRVRPRTVGSRPLARAHGAERRAFPRPQRQSLCCDEFYSSQDELYLSPGHKFFNPKTSRRVRSRSVRGCIDADFPDQMIVGKASTRST